MARRSNWHVDFEQGFASDPFIRIRLWERGCFIEINLAAFAWRPAGRFAFSTCNGARPLASRQRELLEQLLKPRVAPQRLPSRVHSQADQFEAAILKSLGQPLKAFVGFSECEIQRGEFKRRDVALLPQIVQFPENAESPAETPPPIRRSRPVVPARARESNTPAKSAGSTQRCGRTVPERRHSPAGNSGCARGPVQ